MGRRVIDKIKIERFMLDYFTGEQLLVPASPPDNVLASYDYVELGAFDGELVWLGSNYPISQSPSPSPTSVSRPPGSPSPSRM